MLKCKKCGCELKPETRFCPRCGEKTVGYCPHCGKELSTDAKYCPGCGKKIAEQFQQEQNTQDESWGEGSVIPQKNQENMESQRILENQYQKVSSNSNIQKKRKGKNIWIAIGVIAVVAIIAIVLWLVGAVGQNQKKIHLGVKSTEDEKYIIELLDQYSIDPIKEESNNEIVETFLQNKYDKYLIKEFCEACIEDGKPSYLGYLLSNKNTYILVTYGYVRDQMVVMMFGSRGEISTDNIFIEFICTFYAERGIYTEYYRGGEGNTDDIFTLDEVIESVIDAIDIKKKTTVAPEVQPSSQAEETEIYAPPIGANPADDIASFMPAEYEYGEDQFIDEYIDDVPYSGNYINKKNGYSLHLYYSNGDHNTANISFFDQVNILTTIDFQFFEYGEDKNYEGTVNVNYADGTTRLVTVYVEQGIRDTEIIVSASDTIDIEGTYTLGSVGVQ